MDTIRTTYINIHKLTLPTHCITVSCMIRAIHNDYFPKQHYGLVFMKETISSLWGKDSICIHYSIKFMLEKVKHSPSSVRLSGWFLQTTHNFLCYLNSQEFVCVSVTNDMIQANRLQRHRKACVKKHGKMKIGVRDGCINKQEDHSFTKSST